MEERVFYYLKDSKVLLIIDNLEDALRKDRSTVRQFLKTLFERLPDLKILSTSRDLISDIGEITERVYELKNLSKNANNSKFVKGLLPQSFHTSKKVPKSLP